MQQPCIEPNKNFIFATILIGLFTTNLCLSIIGPFFPLKASYYGIDQSKLGIIFSGFPLGAIFCTFSIGKKMALNRKPYMVTGIALQVIGMIGFGTIFLWDNEAIIIAVAVVLRILMGIGMSMFETPSLSFLPMLFNDEMDQKLGLMEGIQSVGLMLGPLLGTLFYYFDGYELPFFGIGCIQFIVLPLVIFFIPNCQQVRTSFRASSKLADRSSFGEDYQLRVNLLMGDPKFEKQAKTTSYLRSFKNFRIVLIFALIFLTAYGFLFLDSAFAIYLDDQFDLDQHSINYIFVVSNLCCMIACQIVSRFSEKQYNSLRLCLIGFITSLIAYFFIGPAEIMDIQPNLILTITMRCVIASCQSLVYVPAMKEFYNTLSSIFHMNEDDEKVGIMASTLYVVAQQTGELFGPLIGDTLCEYRSFQDATFYLAAFNISAITILFLCKKLFKVDEIQKIVYRSQMKNTSQDTLEENQGKETCDTAQVQECFETVEENNNVN